MGVLRIKGSPFWQIDYYVNGRRVRESTKSRSKEFARAALAARKADVARAKFGLARDSMSLSGLIEDFKAHCKSRLGKRTYQNYSKHLDVLDSELRDYRIGDIGRKEVEKVIIKIAGQREPATANRYLATYKAMFNLAEEWELIPKNPARFIKQLRENNRRDRVLSLDEERRIFEHARDPHDLVIMMALDTGMRLGEIMSLTWSRVNMDDGIIAIEARKTKSGAPRIVPIPFRLMERLKSEGPQKGAVIKWAGKPMKSPRTAFERILRLTGIKDLHFHDLRHTYSSRLAAGGVRVELMRDALGHSDIKMTNRYTHFAPERLDDLRHAIDKVTQR